MSSGLFRRPRGRYFPTKFDTSRMQKDMLSLQQQFGVNVLWYVFDYANTAVNPTYDERDLSTGGVYDGPYRIPVISAARVMGPQEGGTEGLYTLDRLTVTASYEQVRRIGMTPDLDLESTPHLNDRLVYENKVFDIQNIRSSGQYDPTHTYLTLLIDAVQVRPDELVYDAAFTSYAAATS